MNVHHAPRARFLARCSLALTTLPLSSRSPDPSFPRSLPGSPATGPRRWGGLVPVFWTHHPSAASETI